MKKSLQSSLIVRISPAWENVIVQDPQFGYHRQLVVRESPVINSCSFASCRQIDRVRKESEESERLLKERLQRADAQRLELEDELSRCKMNMASERLMTDEQLSTAKQRIRTEEVSWVHPLELHRHILGGETAQCVDTATWVMGRPWPCHLSLKVLFWWRKKTEWNRLTQVHLENRC